MQLMQIMVQEQTLKNMEAASRAMRERMSPILTAEQQRTYDDQQAQQAAQIRANVEQLRRDAGVGSNELAGMDPSVPPPANLRLQFDLSINGIELIRTLTSTRGAAVRFDGPNGLSIEALPVLVGVDEVSIELKLYEPGSSGRRLVGRTQSQATLTNPKLTSPSGGSSSSQSLLRGRRAYNVGLSVTATYL
jgi:hypothetical protein